MSDTVNPCYVLHGHGLRVAWNGAAERRAAETVLEYHGFAPTAVMTEGWALTLHEHVEKPDEAAFVAEHEGGLALWRLDDVHYLVHSAGVLRVDTAQGTIAGVLPPSEASVSVELYVALTLALLLLLEAAGYCPVHAACLVSPAGDGVLLVGPSDSGKSTMALHLVEQGWHYLTDDSVLLYAHDGEIAVLPLRRDFCLDPDAETLFPALAGAEDRMITDADKWRIRMDGLYPTQQTMQAAVNLVLFPVISGDAASRVEKLRPIEAITALLPQASLLRRDATHAQTFMRMVSRLAAQAPAYRFLSGTDVYRDGALLHTLLLSLLPSHVQTEA